MESEIKRKLFHLVSLGYVAGLYGIPEPAYIVALLSFLALVSLVEFLRLKFKPVNDWFFRHFGGLFRKEEGTRLTGAFWMLLGVTITVTLSAEKQVAVSAILYLILGDGVASLAGKSLRGPRWPNSVKRLTGSLACFLVCVLIGYYLLLPTHGWIGVLAGALTATVVEVLPLPLNDNLTIPVGSVLTLLIF
ncbi:MAG: hypothetical protein LHV69_05820 [Elusimicrobia bacterium]|nr:hypothetical protein [Candidatus Obscuribacterium magneticum]